MLQNINLSVMKYITSVNTIWMELSVLFDQDENLKTQKII